MVYVVWSLPFALWMLVGYVRAVPAELEEAAAVDGAGRLRTLVSVTAPLLAPGIVATALFAFITAWNEFFFALVLLKTPEKQTLPVVLTHFIGAEGVADLGPLAAAAFLATLPSLVVFAIVQTPHHGRYDGRGGEGLMRARRLARPPFSWLSCCCSPAAPAAGDGRHGRHASPSASSPSPGRRSPSTPTRRW